MKYKEKDQVLIKTYYPMVITGTVVHVGKSIKSYYVSAGTYSGYFEEDELEYLQESVNTMPTLATEPEKSETGSLRFNTGKPQTNEINPDFILEMGRVLERSRLKYPRANWALGNNYSVPYDSLMRHLLAWQGGEKNDSESGYSHLAHAALNIMMLHYYEERFPGLDDRIFKKEKK